jgi:hypothetical protein
LTKVSDDVRSFTYLRSGTDPCAPSWPGRFYRRSRRAASQHMRKLMRQPGIFGSIWGRGAPRHSLGGQIAPNALPCELSNFCFLKTNMDNLLEKTGATKNPPLFNVSDVFEIYGPPLYSGGINGIQYGLITRQSWKSRA